MRCWFLRTYTHISPTTRKGSIKELSRHVRMSRRQGRAYWGRDIYRYLLWQRDQFRWRLQSAARPNKVPVQLEDSHRNSTILCGWLHQLSLHLTQGSAFWWAAGSGSEERKRPTKQNLCRHQAYVRGAFNSRGWDRSHPQLTPPRTDVIRSDRSLSSDSRSLFDGKFTAFHARTYR